MLFFVSTLICPSVCSPALGECLFIEFLLASSWLVWCLDVFFCHAYIMAPLFPISVIFIYFVLLYYHIPTRAT